MPSVRISARKPVILIEEFPESPQFLQANTRIAAQLGHYRFLPNSIQSSYHSALYGLRHCQRPKISNRRPQRTRSHGPRKVSTVERRLGRVLYCGSDVYQGQIALAVWVSTILMAEIDHWSFQPFAQKWHDNQVTHFPGTASVHITLSSLWKMDSSGLYWKCIINLKYTKLQIFRMYDYYLVLWTRHWYVALREKHWFRVFQNDGLTIRGF